jgi:hypothetical protein
VLCGLPGHRRKQPDAHPGADQGADGVGLVALADDRGLDARGVEQPVGQGSLFGLAGLSELLLLIVVIAGLR